MHSICSRIITLIYYSLSLFILFIVSLWASCNCHSICGIIKVFNKEIKLPIGSGYGKWQTMSAWQGWISFPHSNMHSPECHQLFIKQGTERNLTSGSHSQRIQTDFLPFSMMASHLCLAGTDRFSSQQPTHTVTKLLRVLVVDSC